MLADRIYNDPSYTLFDAMIDMGAVTERHVHEVVAAERGQALWAGGSLGRREMLPNSDLDLFVLSDRPGPPVDVAISGLDKVDLGQLLLEDAVTLLETTLVDANRIVDGRPLEASALGENLRAAVRSINTSDRQLANLRADHAYYRRLALPAEADAVWTQHQVQQRDRRGSCCCSISFIGTRPAKYRRSAPGPRNSRTPLSRSRPHCIAERPAAPSSWFCW